MNRSLNRCYHAPGGILPSRSRNETEIAGAVNALPLVFALYRDSDPHIEKSHQYTTYQFLRKDVLS
jgi:hypothetical protein